MRKDFIHFFCLLFFVLFSFSNAQAQFPYNNSIVLGDDFSDFQNVGGNVSFTPYGAELTNNTSQTRGIYLNDLAFTIDRGFIISFDYIMTGRGSNGFGFGDGLALVLFDGSVIDPVMGANGSGLGYSYSRSLYSNGNVNGLSKGFLAVGLDLYGNFKYRMANYTEFRNGIRTLTGEDNHVTIRGQGDLQKGYPVLISQSVSDINKRYKLDISNGEYTSNFEAPDTDFSFSLRENRGNDLSDIDAGFGHPSYRKVTVSMYPGLKESVKGFFINVEIIHGNQMNRIIKDYFIPNSSSIVYKEAKTEGTDEYVTKVLKAPKTFKIGFTAATGGAMQVNMVRNLSVYLPFSPVVQDVLMDDVCRDKPTVIDVLANSVGFDTNLYEEEGDLHPLGKKEFLDPYSFNFMTLINGILENTVNPYLAITAAGVYEYDPVTSKVVFMPNDEGVSQASDVVYFSIRNKKKIANNFDLGNEQFRSKSATVKLNFGHNCNDILIINGNAI
ncbi:lectin-like domain-containing protein [Myroides odoratus]|uniref:lectin-like domain-containing protein n=1 Tax=Myroides odoratus TaxID=256 RepID=UPI0039B08D7A